MSGIKSVVFKKGLATCWVVLMILLLSTCKEKEIYSPIPYIEFKTAFQNPSDLNTLTLVFSFKDGDGDIGLTNADTIPAYDPVTNPFYYNLYVYYYQAVNGVFEPYILPFSGDTLINKFRVQYLTPDGRHKAIRGDIETQVPLVDRNFDPSTNDTIQFRFFIYDRLKHQSNIIQTPPVIRRR